MKRKGSVINPLIRPLEFINYENDVEAALVAFKEVCRGADSVNMELVGDFTYTGKKQQITIRIRSVDGTDDGAK